MTDTTQQLERKHPLHVLALGALGIVYGDIGTSPLYAVQECFAHGLAVEQTNVLGVISLIFWSITLVVSLKYIFIIMRADNKGEGGILALMAMAIVGARKSKLGYRTIILIGLIGASLFFGDSIITPAISVLSAVEGLNVAAPHLKDYVLPIAISILVVLFFFQSHGTHKVGSFFGPIMIIWFVVLGIMGVHGILMAPKILEAINPYYAFNMLVHHGWASFAIMGAALLCFTGAEALYADMGHFGAKPIRLAWFALVKPALVLNYFGQGALLLAKPEAATNPFFLLVPSDFTLALVILSAVATVIASQAVISGAFSVVQQAMQLDYLPRFTILHTSAKEIGQIYIPQINRILCVAVLILVILFRTSGALANAYGFAVVGTFLCSTILVYTVMRHVWEWPRWVALLIISPFLLTDATYFATAAAKIPEGGWLPLTIGIGIFTIFITWRQGREIVRATRRNKAKNLDKFISALSPEHPIRVEGTAIYLSSISGVIPQAMISNLNHNKVLHERVIILTISTENEPRVPEDQRLQITTLPMGFYRVILSYGFMERPDVFTDLQNYLMADCPLLPEDTSFFIGHDTYVEGDHPLYPQWREKLFLWLSNHAEEAFAYFRIPTERVVELGIQIKV